MKKPLHIRQLPSHLQTYNYALVSLTIHLQSQTHTSTDTQIHTQTRVHVYKYAIHVGTVVLMHNATGLMPEMPVSGLSSHRPIQNGGKSTS